MRVGEKEPYVEVAEVGKVYRSGTAAAIEAVSSVSFTVARGQFVAVLGPSGCGKSTLLMMVGGLEAVTAGRITIGGEPMTGPRTSIGIMFQDSTLLPWKSAYDNVLFPIRVLKRPLACYRDGARQLLERVGLDGFMHKKPHELSGGMRQRVAICRALIYDPELLLMDEPFSALDAITRDEMNELLLDLWQQYTKTALFVTHSIREAVFLADRVLVMTRRPATIVEDLMIPFARPRPLAIGESREFNEICGHLRERIEKGHYRGRERRFEANMAPQELVG
ncbi:MAG: ABC transporter ATP-binding protein [Alphaproteobacteria bacterium]|nr:MAG: ABC transporter ATP-binding protein [Alphaproteobacteria bacterium]